MFAIMNRKFNLLLCCSLEPFLVKTATGLAIASKPGGDYGSVDGEVYLKNVGELPQSINASLTEKSE